MSSEAILSVKNFNLSFLSPVPTKGESFQLQDICFEIARGETHALVGESGSGKSITALSILRLLEGINSIKTSGEIHFNGTSVDNADIEVVRKIRGNDIAMIFQEPMTSLNPVYTVGNQIVESLNIHKNTNGDNSVEKAIELLAKTGIQEPEYRFNCYPHQLSGGQRQRVMIAMALACNPLLLIADEPTTALDITTQGQILDLVKTIQNETGMSLLLVTHDLNLVKKRADSVSIMHEGKIIEQGTIKEIFNAPKQQYTIKLLDSAPTKTKPLCPPSDTVIHIENLSCSFIIRSSWKFPFKRSETKIKAVDDINLSVQRERTLGVVGESGSGKTTLAQCILGLVPYQGKIVFNYDNNDIVLSNLSMRKMRPHRKNIQVVFQDPFSSLSPRMTIEQIVSEGLGVHESLSAEQKDQKVKQVLLDVELDPSIGGRFPHEFSGGQRQRIAIARAIILRPKLLILDEPTSALDMTIQKQVLQLLERLQKRYGLTYIFISHDLRTVRSISDHIAIIQDGKIVEYGQTQNLIANPKQEYTRRLFDAAFN